MAGSSLETIQNKVRKLTRAVSENQLSTSDLNDYINTFVLYDFPEHLRLFNLKSTFTFYTLPFVDTYSTTSNPNSPLYNFLNEYITIDKPIFIAGYQSLYSESREQFYSIYPIVNSIASIGYAGDGNEKKFSGVVNSQQANIPQGSTQFICLLQNNVLFSSIDIYGNGLAMADIPILDSTSGNPTNYGLLYNALTTDVPVPLSLAAPYNTEKGFPTTNYINYITGQFTVTFATAPRVGIAINSQTVPVNPTLPQALLFYDGQFIVRPVPDQSYRVDIEVFQQPTALLNENDEPLLSEWWQYIAYGAAVKVLQDRMDLDSVNMIMPEFKKQECLILRRTIVQQTSQRAATVYTEQTQTGAYGSGWYYGGGNF